MTLATLSARLAFINCETALRAKKLFEPALRLAASS
jgi:hypothetical protein